MPPHSVFEWVIGQNLPRKKTKSSGREVVKIEVTTDDETDTDSITVTYPRASKSSGRRNKQHKRPSEPVPPEQRKKVTFEEKPLKSALKKRHEPSSSEPSSAASSEASSEASSNESTADERSEEEPQTKSRKARGARSENPPSCEARRLLLLTKMEEITKNCSGSGSGNGNGSGNGGGNGKEVKGGDKGNGKAAQGKKGAKNKSDTEAESGASTGDATSVEETGTESEPEPPKAKKKNKQQTAAVPSEPEATAATNAELGQPKKEKQSGKKKGNEKKEKQNADEAAETKTGSQAEGGGEASESKEAAEKKTQDDPADENTAGNNKDNETKKGGTVDEKRTDAPHHPHLIMPVRKRSIQMEHVVEDPARDAPPNAYFDSDKNICRVYHGPYWGYPYGRPYTPGSFYPQFPAPTWFPVSDTQATHGRRDDGPQIPPGFPPPPHQPVHAMPYPTWGQPYGQFPPAPPYGSAQQRPVGVSGIPGSPLAAEDLKRYGFGLNPLFGNLRTGLGEKHESRGPPSRERHRTPHDEYKSAKGSGVQWNTPPTTWVKLPSNKSKNGSRSGRQNNDGSNEKKKKDERSSNHGNNNNDDWGNWGNNESNNNNHNNHNHNPTNDGPNDWTNSNSNNHDNNDWCNNGSNDWDNANNDANNWANTNNDNTGWENNDNNDNTNDWGNNNNNSNNDDDNDDNNKNKNANNTPKPSPEPFRPDPVVSMPGSWSPPGGKAGIEWKGGDDNNAASWMDPTAAQAAADW
ncbi:hypothetical protein VTH06DRAFT_3643 [Thermothelomyces fergusii]